MPNCVKIASSYCAYFTHVIAEDKELELSEDEELESFTISKVSMN